MDGSLWPRRLATVRTSAPEAMAQPLGVAGPSQTGQLAPSRSSLGRQADAEPGEVIDFTCRTDDLLHVIVGHDGPLRALGVLHGGVCGRVAADPFPPDGLLQGRPQHRVLIADGTLPHPSQSKASHPAVDIGHAYRGHGLLGDCVCLD